MARFIEIPHHRLHKAGTSSFVNVEHITDVVASATAGEEFVRVHLSSGEYIDTDLDVSHVMGLINV